MRQLWNLLLTVNCNFGQLTESFTRNQVAPGFSDAKLKKRLLENTGLTSEQTIRPFQSSYNANSRLQRLEDKPAELDRTTESQRPKKMNR